MAFAFGDMSYVYRRSCNVYRHLWAVLAAMFLVRVGGVVLVLAGVLSLVLAGCKGRSAIIPLIYCSEVCVVFGACGLCCWLSLVRVGCCLLVPVSCVDCVVFVLLVRVGCVCCDVCGLCWLWYLWVAFGYVYRRSCVGLQTM